MRKKTKRFFAEVWDFTKETFTRWDNDDPWRLSAVVAYYAIFSMPGLMMIVISFSGYFYQEEAVTGQLYEEISELVGAEAALQIEGMVRQASMDDSFTISTVIGIATLIFAATGVFFHLKVSLNHIWGVAAQPKKAWLKLIIDRVFSFGMILAIGFLLLVSLVLSSMLSALSGYISSHISEYSVYLFRLLDIVISFGMITLLFGLIYKVLPDVKIRWKDVWIGAAVTALLFILGKTLIGFYLGQSNPGSAYGAAGSVILILTWVSYSSLILFLGAEFTQVYSQRYGTTIEPADYAVRVPRLSDEREKEKKKREKMIEKQEKEEKSDLDKVVNS